jgi:hypothetical protein
LQIGAGDLIPPGALLGDTSRKPATGSDTTAGTASGSAASVSDPDTAAYTPPLESTSSNGATNGTASSTFNPAGYPNTGYFNTGHSNPAANGQSDGAAPSAPSLHGQSSFATSATHGFVGVNPAESAPEAGGVPFSTANSYFQAPTPIQPDLPCQPFTENPQTPLGTPPPPTRVAPQPSYPGPFTMPKADVPPPVAVPPENSPESDPAAIQPSTNGAGTVNYVNQMLGRMFPHRVSHQQT